MQRRWTAIVLASAITLAGAEAAADTVRVRDADQVAGPHAIRAMTVHNDGPVVEVDVRHRRAAWKGRVRIALDTRGGRRPEYVATIGRGGVASTFRLANGRRWACSARRASSPTTSAVTTLSVPRTCLGDAGDLRVRAVATSRGRTSDAAASGLVQKQSRPNVVMIMVDDMRADDLVYMPRTQQLLADQGVTFANSFAPYPLCCPARSSVLLGEYAHNHKVWSHLAPWGFPALDDHSTIATWMHDAGYATTYIGKYLNGYGNRPEPGKTEGNSVHYVPPGWDDWRASIDGGLPGGDPMDGGTYRYYDTTLVDNGHGFHNYVGRYQTRVYGRLAERVIRDRAASAKPFFFYLSFSAPHAGLPKEADDPGNSYDANGHEYRIRTPAVTDDVRGIFDGVIRAAPGADWDKAKAVDKPDYLNQIPAPDDTELAAVLEAARQRAESLAVVDEQVQKVVDALNASGELGDTLIIFTSDNGYFLGEQGIRQGKILPYEPSLRTPTLMRGPGIPAGQVRYDPFLSIDFAPTIAQFAGVKPDISQDGMSMLGVARRGDQGWWRPVLTETGPGSTVRTTDESGLPVDADHEPDIRWIIGMRTDRYLYTNIATGEEELYDLAVDPEEYDNLVAPGGTARKGYDRILELMREQVAKVRACKGAECRVPLPSELGTGPGQSIVNPAYTPGPVPSPPAP